MRKRLTGQFIVAAIVSACLAFSVPLAARKGGSHGSSHASSGAKSSGASKPVHVKAYTKKDGTRVEAHDRKAPEPKTSTPHTEPVRATPPPIRLVTDPGTGRRTFTNDSLPPLPARALPFTAATLSTPPRSVMSRPTSAVVVTGRATPIRSIAPSGAAVRDARGRTQRSAAARHAFARQTGFPNGRPGYVIDHVKPLACGGADAPSNMQWQTIAAAKAKDKFERMGCR